MPVMPKKRFGGVALAKVLSRVLHEQVPSSKLKREAHHIHLYLSG
jgi:hypothetical protein